MYLDTAQITAPSFRYDAAPDHALRPATLRFILHCIQVVMDSALLVAGALAPVLPFLSGAPVFQSEPAAVLVPLFLLCALLVGAYSLETLLATHLSWLRAIKAVLLTFAIVGVFSMATGTMPNVPAWQVAARVAAALAFVLAGRTLLNAVVARRLGHRILEQVYVIDGTDQRTPPRGYQALDCVACGLAPDSHDPLMLHRLATRLGRADRILVSCPPEHRAKWSVMLKGLGVDGGLIAPELEPLGIQHSALAPDAPVIMVSKGALSLSDRVLKRMLDLAITVPVLLALALPMAIIAMLIKLDSPGPVLFRQKRIGQRNHMFSIYKFRSMRVERCDENGTRSTGRNDDRITRVGAFIRRTSIDELPQLFNVLLGDMSLVGPRPHAMQSRAQDLLFWEIDARYFLRHAVKPGITGLAQVRGFRGATHNTSDLTNRLRADLDYLTHWSLWRDLVILARTAMVLVHKNAY